MNTALADWVQSKKLEILEDFKTNIDIFINSCNAKMLMDSKLAMDKEAGYTIKYLIPYKDKMKEASKVDIVNFQEYLNNVENENNHLILSAPDVPEKVEAWIIKGLYAEILDTINSADWYEFIPETEKVWNYWNKEVA